MQSGQAIVNPREIREFERKLKAFTNQLNDDMKRVQSELRRLGETWRDQEHLRFDQEFQQTAKMLRKFIADSNQYCPFLTRKAQRAEEYLRQR